MSPTNFYEVMDKYGDLLWGGENVHEAVGFYRRFEGASVFVSTWNTQNEDEYRLITDKIEITPVLAATILNEKERV